MIKTFLANIGQNSYISGALDTMNQLANKFCQNVKVIDTQTNMNDRMYVVTIVYEEK